MNKGFKKRLLIFSSIAVVSVGAAFAHKHFYLQGAQLEKSQDAPVLPSVIDPDAQARAIEIIEAAADKSQVPKEV